MGRTATLELTWMAGSNPGWGDADDGTLIAAAATGDEAATEALLSRATPRAFRLAWRLLGDPDRAREACQEVLIRVHRATPRLDPARPLGPYVRQVTLNVCRDRMSARARRAREVVAARPPDVAAAGPGVERLVEGRRLAAAVRACLDELTPRERTAFVLRQLEGRSAAEAARLMRCRPSTVRFHCHRARARLRECLLARHPDLEEAIR